MKEVSKEKTAALGDTSNSIPEANPHTPGPAPEAPTPIAPQAGASPSRRRPPKKPATSAFWDRLFPYQNMNALEAVNKFSGKRRVESGKKRKDPR